MSEEHGHERPVKPFSDLHRHGNHVRATLLHDPTVEGLDVALYMDGSASMENEYGPRGVLAKLGGVENKVEPHMRWMLEYLASKDRNGMLRVAYWATGDGAKLEHLGELAGKDAKDYKFPGPDQYGKGTVMLPAVRDFIGYIQKHQDELERGLAIFVTDSELYDPEDVHAYTKQVAHEINEGNLPRVNFVFVGIGDEVDEEQMERVCHADYEGQGHLWCHSVAGEIEEMSEIVAVLVDETMTVASGGTITDDNGQIIKRYEARLPAVLEFEVPEACEAFNLEIAGETYTQPLPSPHHGEGEHHEGQHHEGEDDHHGGGHHRRPAHHGESDDHHGGRH